MSYERHRNKNWGLRESPSYDDANLAVLMDIRDRLQALNQTLVNIENLARCPNVSRGFVAMNRLRIHVEKRWPVAKTKSRKK